MNQRPELQYTPHRCPFLNQDVSAIRAQQTNGTWPIVNCQDKDTACFQHPCAFTTDGGDWPFDEK